MKTNFINLIMAGKAMKNTGRSPRVVRGSSEGRQTRFARFAAMLLMLITMSVGQAWGIYYYRGNQNSWGATAMTVSDDSYYEYFQITGSGSATESFKITTSTSWDSGNSYDYKQWYKDWSDTNYKNCNVDGNWGENNGNTNACIYAAKPYYIIVYYPYTTKNSTSSPRICARKTLPNDAPAETKYAVTISAAAGGSVSPSGSQQIGATGVNVTATPSSGYKFVNWSTTGGASVASSTSATTKVTATATGSVTANFAENLNSGWYVAGSFNNWGNTTDELIKESGSSSVARVTITLSAGDYTFKIYNKSDKWNGLNSTTVANGVTYTLGNNSGGNLNLTGIAAGDYEFVYNISTRELTVNFPTPACTTGAPSIVWATAPADGTVGGSMTASVTVPVGSTVAWTSSKTSVATVNESTGAISYKAAGTATIRATVTNNDYCTTTKFIEKSITVTAAPTYTVTISNGDHGTVAPNGNQQVGSTGISITATPADGYAFANWAVTGGAAVASATSATTTLTATAAGTVTANYTEDLATGYCLRGFGSFTNNMYYFMKKTGESSGTVGYYELELTAGNHTFKVFGESTWYGNNGTMKRDNCTSWTMSSSADNCTITADVAGTYIFAFDTNTKKLSVTYPTPDSYAIHYVTNGGDAIADGSYSSIAAFELPVPTRTGYAFRGWYDNGEFTGERITSIAKGSTGEKTFYAKWKQEGWYLHYQTADDAWHDHLFTGDPLEVTREFADAAHNYPMEICKVQHGEDDKYYKNENYMTKDNCTGWVYRPDQDRHGFTSTVAGKYIFTITGTNGYGEPILSMTYPCEPTSYELWHKDKGQIAVFKETGKANEYELTFELRNDIINNLYIKDNCDNTYGSSAYISPGNSITLNTTQSTFNFGGASQDKHWHYTFNSSTKVLSCDAKPEEEKVQAVYYIYKGTTLALPAGNTYTITASEPAYYYNTLTESTARYPATDALTISGNNITGNTLGKYTLSYSGGTTIIYVYRYYVKFPWGACNGIDDADFNRKWKWAAMDASAWNGTTFTVTGLWAEETKSAPKANIGWDYYYDWDGRYRYDGEGTSVLFPGYDEQSHAGKWAESYADGVVNWNTNAKDHGGSNYLPLTPLLDAGMTCGVNYIDVTYTTTVPASGTTAPTTGGNFTQAKSSKIDDVTYYTLTYGAVPVGTGIVTHNATGDKVAAGTVVTFTAVGESGSHFVGWYSDAECTNPISSGVSGNHYQVTVSADVTAYAKFESSIVYFKNTDNWANVYAYAWNGDGTDKNAGWPGEAMTYAGTFDCVDYYSYVLPKDYANIIFNNNNGSKTGDIDLTSTDYGKCWDGTAWVAMPTASTPYTITYTPAHVTIAGDKPATAACGDEINFTVTPDDGYVITAVTVNGNAAVHGVGNAYSFTMPAENVTVEATAVYSQAGWYLGYQAAEQGEYDTWIEEILTDNHDGTFSITKQLPKGSEYQYKILKKNDAGVTIPAEIYSNGGTMTAGNCTDWTFNPNSKDAPCCRIATTIDGDYVFTFTESNKKVSVTYPVISGAATAYTNDGVASGVKSQNTDIMIQGFYWEFDGTAKTSPWLTPYGDTKWATLIADDYKLADEMAKNFNLVWLPASAVSADRMGYLPIQYSDQNSEWGTADNLKLLTARLKEKGSHPVADIVVNHMGSNGDACSLAPQNFGQYGQFDPNFFWIPKSDEIYSTGADGIYNSHGSCLGSVKASHPFLKEDNYKIGNTDTYWSYAEYNCIYARDLAHDKDSVRMMVRSYLTWMRNEMGFDGWRFDFAKGINAKYITNYIEHTQPYFAVCESFDGSESRILPVLEQAGYKTYMFDFLTKQDVINIGIGKGQYTNIRMHGLIAQEYKGRKINKYAVTFVENHDTFRENATGDGDNLKNMSRVGNKFDNSNNKIIQANAYILTMPGVPCVFYPHWAEFKDPIKAIINARRMTGVHSESTVTDESADGKYIARIIGTTGDIWLKLGPNSGYDVVPTYRENDIEYKYTTAYVGENCGVYYHPTAQNPAKAEVEIISLTHPNDWYIGNTAKIQALTNIPNATYTWWVKLPGTENFIELTNHDGTIDYLLSGEGIYTFKVTATHGVGVTATDTKEFTVDAVAYFVKYKFDGTNWEDRLMTKQEDGVYTYYEAGESRFGYNGATSCANVHMYGKPDGDCRQPENPNNIDLSGNTGVEVVFVYNPATDILTIYNLADGMYRIMSEKAGKKFYSNTVSAVNAGDGQDVSFFAYADGTLQWQKFDGNTWNDVPSGVITNSITEDHVWVAKSGITGGTQLNGLKKYTGSYYIFSGYTSQTETVAAGKMSSFTNTNDPTEYFNNYWVKHVSVKTDAAATVGNSINHNLAIRLNDYKLPDNTNLRYAYNSTTNYFGRAFLSGSSTDKFLMAYGQNVGNKETGDDAEQSNPASWVKFSDASDWMYIAYVNANTSNSKDAQIRLAAYYNGSWQYLLSSTGNDDSYKSILGHVSTTTTENLPFMVAYDYKTNRIIAAWNPTGDDVISVNTTVDADMIVLRDADSKAKPDMFVLDNDAKVNVIRRLIFALQMERDNLVYSNNTYKNGLRSQLFQVCLPYNVKMGEISGLSDYNTNWHFQVYYGEKRAQTGWQTGISDFWYDMGWSKNTTLQANRGYVVYSGLQYSDYHEIGTGKYDGEGNEIMRARKYLFFPSETKAGGWTIDGVDTYDETTYTPIECTISGREKVDSDWRLTGVPGWFSAKMTAPDPAKGWHSKTDANYQVSSQECANWLYEWRGDYGGYALKFAPDYALNPTSAYMMQYHGTVGWTAAAYNFDDTPVSESVGARKMARAGMPLSSKYCIEIGGLYDMEADQAYVLLEADGSDDYVIGADMSKISSSQFNQIYSVTAGYELAANVVADTTTHVALGLNLPESGNYTISLSSMTMGAAVPYLYDAELDTYTDLSAQSYEFSAIAGQHQTGRFSLVFGYQAPQAPTDIQNIASGELSAAVVDGKLVISGATNSNVALYDAAGRMMYEGKISGNAIPAPAAAGVYMLKCANKTAKVVIR